MYYTIVKTKCSVVRLSDLIVDDLCVIFINCIVVGGLLQYSQLTLNNSGVR